MDRRALFLVAVLLFAARSAIAQDSFKRDEYILWVDGKARTYLLFRPANAQRPLPVVFGLHGGFGTGEIFAETAKLHQARGAEDFIFVYPSGYRRSWNAGICCGQAHEQDIDDLKFFRAMMDTLARRPDVDERYFFVTGFSNGAMMTYRLACDLPERITAVAPVGAGSGKPLSECKPSRPVAILHLHGLRDEWAPFAGGESAREQAGVQPAIEPGIAFWSERNACSGSAASTRLEGASCRAGNGCEREVELCTVEGLAHQWPGDDPSARSVRNFGAGAPAVRGSDAILDFFRGYLNKN